MVVITREIGVSSTLRLLDSIAGVFQILDHPLSAFAGDDNKQ